MNDLGELHAVDARTERALIELVRMIIRQKPAERGVEHWERGWKENLDDYRSSGDVADLRPRYIRLGLPLRLNGRFVIPEAPDFEWRWYRKFFAQIADRWLADAKEIWEFGCGSGHNVAWLATRFRQKRIVGLDWSDASMAICAALDRPNVAHKQFDFFNPCDPSPVGATVLTVGAMEQTGTRWQPMLDYLLASKPRRVVHIEPDVALYDPTNAVDQTAIEAHKVRGFWTGYHEEIERLQNQGRAVIEHRERTGFGSLLTEGYSSLVWRPL